jgi:hypothetical protein
MLEIKMASGKNTEIYKKVPAARYLFLKSGTHPVAEIIQISGICHGERTERKKNTVMY